LYSRRIPPDIDFWHLVLLRGAQSLGIGFLFVPASVLAYQTVPRRLQGDAAALFTMFRNVAGSVGIALSTSAITMRTQAHMAYLSAHLSDANPNLRATVAAIAAGVRNLGTVAGGATQAAMKQVYQTLSAQAGLLAYKDVFLYCALLAFAYVPLTFLFAPVKATRKAGAE
jgi:DHA2 family multidrug resistance protein